MKKEEKSKSQFLFPPDSNSDCHTCHFLSLDSEWCKKESMHFFSPLFISFFLLFFPLLIRGGPLFRELVSDGISPGAAHSNLHPQQSHLHAHGAHRDQQDPCGRDQARGAGGGEHPGGGRPLPRCFRWIPGQRDAGSFQRRPGPTIRGCVLAILWIVWDDATVCVYGIFIGSAHSFSITNIYNRRAELENLSCAASLAKNTEFIEEMPGLL